MPVILIHKQTHAVPQYKELSASRLFCQSTCFLQFLAIPEHTRKASVTGLLKAYRIYRLFIDRESIIKHCH